VRPFADTLDGSFSLHAVEELVPWLERCDAVVCDPACRRTKRPNGLSFDSLKRVPPNGDRRRWPERTGRTRGRIGSPYGAVIVTRTRARWHV